MTSLGIDIGPDGGSLVDSADELVGDIIEFAVDVIVQVAEHVVEIRETALDAAEKFVENLKEAAEDVASMAIAGLVSIKDAWNSLDPGLKRWFVIGMSTFISFIEVRNKEERKRFLELALSYPAQIEIR